MSTWIPPRGSTGKGKIKKEAWEPLCATLSEIQPPEKKRGNKKGRKEEKHFPFSLGSILILLFLSFEGE